MGRKEFEASRADGVHARMARMAGQWQGRFRLWFEPGEPAEDSVQSGSIRVLLGARVLLHEYSGQCNGETMEGVALIAHHLDERRYETAWAESFGTGTSIMFSTGTGGDPRLSVLGSSPTAKAARAGAGASRSSSQTTTRLTCACTTSPRPVKRLWRWK